MNNKLQLLQHSLGVGDFGDKKSYRNHFCTGPRSTDYDDCMALVSDGLMTHRAGYELSGGDDIFHVTQKGVDYVALNSPDRPKLTRSQQRYRSFLDSETNFSFGEWMRFKRT